MAGEMMKISFVFAGEPQYVKKIRNVENAVTDLTPAWQEIAADFYKTEGELFQSATGWAPLKETYLEWKRRKGLSSRIMVATGALEASLTNPSAPGAMCVMSPMALTLGTLVRTKNGKFNLGLIHQLGTRYSTKRGTRYSTKREVIRLTDAQKLRWNRYISRCAQRQIKEARDGKAF